MDDQKIKINIKDELEFNQFIELMFKYPMMKKMTGSITIHFFEGEIRAAEMNPTWRTIKHLRGFLKIQEEKIK